MYKLLRQILKELKEINEKLQAIESSKEQNVNYFGNEKPKVMKQGDVHFKLK